MAWNWKSEMCLNYFLSFYFLFSSSFSFFFLFFFSSSLSSSSFTPSSSSSSSSSPPHVFFLFLTYLFSFLSINSTAWCWTEPLGLLLLKKCFRRWIRKSMIIIFLRRLWERLRICYELYVGIFYGKKCLLKQIPLQMPKYSTLFRQQIAKALGLSVTEAICYHFDDSKT